MEGLKIYRASAEAHKSYPVEWKPKAGQGASLYIIRLQSPHQIRQHKIILAR
jgi:hypothetical protein